MNRRTGNYTAFYVKTPFMESNLGALVAHDFCYYNMLRLWKSLDTAFPFVDSHAKTYNVRDNSAWETLKQRLHERLLLSKNIILVLSSNTKASRALNEEINYGVGELGLPVIVVYPDLENNQITNGTGLNISTLQPYWDKLPTFRRLMDKVPTFHIPCKKNYIASALTDPDVTIQHKKENKRYFYGE